MSALYPNVIIGGQQLAAIRHQAEETFERMWKMAVPCEPSPELSVVTMLGSYAWLAGKLGIPESECRFERLSAAMCRRAVEICEKVIAGLEREAGSQ